MKGLNEIIKEAFFDDNDTPVKAAIEEWINKHAEEDAKSIQINDDLTLNL